MSRAVVLFLMLVVVFPASGATLHVARDRSGDFTVIQAAVDAAASGDTILIGPGRYNEGAIVTTPGWAAFVRVVARQSELTLIGAGADQTIIGPTTPWSLADGWNIGVVVGPYWGNSRIWISGIGFENMAYGVKGSEAPELATLSDCRFYMNNSSVRFALGGALEVNNCKFDLMPRDYNELSTNGMRSVQVVNCQFALASEHTWRQEAVHLESTSDAVITGCTFRGGDVGLGLYGMGPTRVSSCVFSDQTSSDDQNPMGVYVSGGSMVMTACVFDMQTNAIFASDYPSVEISHTQILDASVSSLNFDHCNSLTMHDCILAHGPRYTVWQQFPCDTKASVADLPHLDMINNDWGTSSADSIAAWIRTCGYVVDYVPFMGQPVPTESTSWGNLKAQFR
jgi:hypothetical protein